MYFRISCKIYFFRYKYSRRCVYPEFECNYFHFNKPQMSSLSERRQKTGRLRFMGSGHSWQQMLRDSCSNRLSCGPRAAPRSMRYPQTFAFDINLPSKLSFRVYSSTIMYANSKQHRNKLFFSCMHKNGPRCVRNGKIGRKDFSIVAYSLTGTSCHLLRESGDCVRRNARLREED